MLRTAMDAAFWDLNLSSGQSLDGTARSVPGEPVPPATARSSRTVRPQQLSFLTRAFPLGIIPSFSFPTLPPSPQKEEEEGGEVKLGGFCIQSFLLGPSSNNWWTGLAGQFRPSKLISNIKKEVMSGDEMELPAAKDVAKHILDKSLYALGLFSHISLTEDTSLLFNVERHGEKKGPRSKATLIHRLPDHDITVEAAWPELFLDSKGTYWEVPASASLDIASLISPSGLRYRFGLHKNSGHPEALNSSSDDVPLSLIPGLCAKAAFSYEKTRDLWREHVTKSPEEEEEPAWLSSYDIQLNEPHAAISGIIGGTCAAWFGGNKNISIQSKKRDPVSVDLFGSLRYTFQRGKFKKTLMTFHELMLGWTSAQLHLL
ncbi:protein TRIGALACTOSYLDIACYLGLYCEROL 4, chloroplastic [Iris pallida]|uniref:Protein TRIGALACTOSYLDIACYLGLYCEROL 4, chloroplastic n=1 Tax=Iris pallida TaxID=29817 RepID=A0AAX6G190_IRIPA|nr:protein TRIGALACTOSYLDIACYLGLYCEROL 4, chloroplastic [Iris pallida]